MDYSIFYRRAINVDRLGVEIDQFDIFVSAYNSSERVGKVFQRIRATAKVWLVHPEYRYSAQELLKVPSGTMVVPTTTEETHQTGMLLSALGPLVGKRLCIDITGFMRHVLIFLFAKLESLGVKQVTAIYSEPHAYSDREDTAFSTTTSGRVRPVRGMRGVTHQHGTDHLVIAVGYDHKLIAEVANQKDDAKVHPLFAFPSLSADMYQQSAIRAAESGDVALQPEWVSNRSFAPANDPFSTAAVVSHLVRQIDSAGGLANVYLSPLSTKVQALGFGLYWLLEGRQRGAVGVLLPECLSYSRETSSGLKRLWEYTIEFG